jgi:hypothetical protein
MLIQLNMSFAEVKPVPPSHPEGVLPPAPLEVVADEELAPAEPVVEVVADVDPPGPAGAPPLPWPPEPV